ncbi:SusC/RagA family TonB-linked outer membrane protein [Sphingobacterium corticibacter]|nr:TonB-dependent receptor [Sphingobacterium corticibacter]
MKIFSRIGLLSILLCFASETVAQQQIVVTGSVNNSLGESLAGATIRVKSNGVVVATNENGQFSIRSPSTDTLVASNVGYVARELPLDNRRTVHITLDASDDFIDEVVVVGYGTRSRSKLLGSVSTINADQLQNRPVTNVSSALSGLAAGVQVKQGNGRPGSDGATIRIRGTGTLNNNNALVIIDGIQGAMDAVNPEDIETISVLKDASAAAIYGARAANGVILITTKKGQQNQATQISYSGIMSHTTPSNKPVFVNDYVTHMRLTNEASNNVGNNAGMYPQTAIDLWIAANENPNGLAPSGLPNYVAYPNTDWGEWIYDNSWLQNHNISVNGGSTASKYQLSARILDNPGIMYNTGLKRYEGRINFETDIKNFLTVGTNTFGSMENIDRGSDTFLYNFLRQTTPGIYPRYEGMFGGAVAGSSESPQVNNILRNLYDVMGSNVISQLNTTWFANLKIVEGLSFETRFNYQIRFDERTAYSNPSGMYDFSTMQRVNSEVNPATLTTSQTTDRRYRKSFDNVLRYKRQFAEHSIGVVLGHNEFYYNRYVFSAQQRGLIDETITNIGTGNEMVSITGDEIDNAMRSFFGNVTYDYDGKYLAEFTLRRDGSSKFGYGRQYGTFPSIALGYLLSKESFMEPVNPYVQDIKIRGSWGRLGNDGGDNLNVYGWHGVYGGVNYSFNGAPVNGLQLVRFGNDLLQWEEAETKELGLEFATFNKRATFEATIYDRQTNNIIRPAQVPITTGTTEAPFYNQAAVSNRGMEFNVRWQDKIGKDFTYRLGANFAYNSNKVTSFEGRFEEGYVLDATGNQIWLSNLGEVSSGGLNRVLEGYQIDEFYVRKVYRGNGTYFNSDGTVNINGGPKTGMIRTEQDYQWVQAMKQAGYSFLTASMNVADRFGSGLYYGDLIYADLNGDGIYGNASDQYFTGTSTTPRYVLGFNLGFTYKGFDMAALFSGEFGLQYYWNELGYNNNVLLAGNQITQRVADNRYYYDPNNPTDPRTNIDGYFPRLKFGAANEVINTQFSDYWLYDADFIRLRNLQVGYTFNNRLTERLKVRNLRVFFSGENLLMWTRFPGLDPEVGAGAEYPTMRQYAFGLNFGF